MWSYSSTTSILQSVYAACHIFAPFTQILLQSTEKEKKKGHRNDIPGVNHDTGFFRLGDGD